MQKILLVFLILILAACKSQEKYSDYDYSYSRSGGKMAVYENFLIKGNNAHYALESPEKKIKKDFKISDEELQRIENSLTQNNFRTIQEDFKKVYDNVSTTINVKKGENSASKSDASFIIEKDKNRWKEIVNTFKEILNSKISPTSDAK